MGAKAESDWLELFESYRLEYPDLASEFERRQSKILPVNWVTQVPNFPHDEKGMATRVSSGIVLNALAEELPELIGGSADLAPSNKTWIKDSLSFQAESPEGRNFHFGVREHAMGAVVNGMAVHGGVIPYGGTFLVFSDYMRPAIRLAALSGYHSIWVFTHDSIGVGEDGPTHQPVEHFAALRSIPNLVVIRPADANEVGEAWKVAIQRREGTTALIFSRQNVSTLDRKIFSPASGLAKGAYILADIGDGDPEIILMASGTEVGLIVDAGSRLAAEGMNVRLVSFPSWELLEKQDASYRQDVFPSSIPARLAVEAGVAQGWARWVGDKGGVISIERFGASAPYSVNLEKFGFTVERVMAEAKALLMKS
jgi:transketolase